MLASTIAALTGRIESRPLLWDRERHQLLIATGPGGNHHKLPSVRCLVRHRGRCRPLVEGTCPEFVPGDLVERVQGVLAASSEDQSTSSHNCPWCSWRSQPDGEVRVSVRFLESVLVRPVGVGEAVPFHELPSSSVKTCSKPLKATSWSSCVPNLTNPSYAASADVGGGFRDAILPLAGRRFNAGVTAHAGARRCAALLADGAIIIAIGHVAIRRMTASYGRNAVPTRLCREEAARMTSRITGTSVNWGCLIRPIILRF